MNTFNDPLLQQQAKRLEIGRKGEAWVAAEERQRLTKPPFSGSAEVSMLWTDEAGNILQRQRDWFLLIDGTAYDLEVQNVLSAVNSLKRLAS